MSGTTASADAGVDVAATDTSTITAEISNAETGLFSSGTSVAATVTLNRIDNDVEAWIAGGSTTAAPMAAPAISTSPARIRRRSPRRC